MQTPSTATKFPSTPAQCRILGILNLTRDSFSDGGRYHRLDAAIEQARALGRDGADIIDLGAESTHPDSEDVSATEEIARLTPLIRAIRADRAAESRSGPLISIDTRKPEVMRATLALGVDLINDVNALRDAEAIDAARGATCGLIIMHARSATGRADRAAESATPAEIRAFFEERVATLTAAGIARERLILDPGMGFFIGADPDASFRVLRNIHELRSLGVPVCVSVSRKSFLGAALANADGAWKADQGSTTPPRPVDQRSAATLAAECWAALAGVEYIRTHDVRALRDALTILGRILR